MTEVRRLLSRSDRALFGYLLLFKFCFFFFAAVSIGLLPIFRTEVFYGLTSYPQEGSPTWQSHFATWDGAHYLKIAEDGYVKGSASCAFYPLWPFSIRTFAFLFGGDVFWTGIALANAISIMAVLLLHRLFVQFEGRAVADQSLMLFLAFPGSVFLSLIYTESLFLLLSVAFFLLLFQRRYGCAAAVAFFLPLTKAIGVFAVAPFLWQLWRERRSWKEYLWLTAPCLGYATYFLTMWLWTGNAFEGFEAQKQFPTEPSIAKILDLPGFLDAFASATELHGSRGSLIDRSFFVLFLALLPGVYRRNTALGLYITVLGIVPASSALFISYSRHVTMCFPIFMVLGRLLGGQERRPAFFYVLALLGGLQTCFLIRYLNFYWTG